VANRHGPILFLVPARAGSRRIAGKNLRLVGGIPLVGWAVRIARGAAGRLDGGPHRVVCSTDDETIAAAARAWGAEVLERPSALATDAATSVEVALHALDAIAAEGPFESLVLVQPTSPLTDPADVVDAVQLHRATSAPVTTVTGGHPGSWHLRLGDGGILEQLGDASRSGPDPGHDVRLTGACYVVGADDLRRTRRFVEPGRTLGQHVDPERSIDVDEPTDLVAAEAVLAARPVRPVAVGAAILGGRHTFVIAEAGVNHNGDPALARRLIEAAAEVGADAVKFQTFDPSALAARGAPTARYQREAGVEAGDQHDMLAALALPAEAWRDLQAHARSLDLVFISTPFDDGSADLLDALGVPALKVGSGELTNTPFIARLARRGRPLLVSTGMADMVEVAAAVDTVRANGDPPLALLHCVSSYPASPADANLRAMETMRRAFGVPVGWSDHTPGIELAPAAVAAGATLIEKHLTLDRTLPGPDHAASIEPSAFRAMMEAIRITEAALGSGIKVPVAAERDVAAVARRSLYWRTSLPAGRVIETGDLDALRPSGGLPPSRLGELVRRQTARAVNAGDRVEAGDVEGLA
jgi:N,N'-diacetyllegionaminate synthase